MIGRYACGLPKVEAARILQNATNMILSNDMTCEIIAFPVLYQYRPAAPPRHPVSRGEQ